MSGCETLTEVGLEVLGDLADEALERELADEELRGLLVPADLAESDGARAVAVGLLDAAGSRRSLPSGFGSELLAWGLAPGRLASGLFGARHDRTRTAGSFDKVVFGKKACVM